MAGALDPVDLGPYGHRQTAGLLDPRRGDRATRAGAGTTVPTTCGRCPPTSYPRGGGGPLAPSSAPPRTGGTRTRVLIFSLKILSLGMPCLLRASSWESSSCPRVEHRAYPMRRSALGRSGSMGPGGGVPRRHGRPGPRPAGVGTGSAFFSRGTWVNRRLCRRSDRTRGATARPVRSSLYRRQGRWTWSSSATCWLPCLCWRTSTAHVTGTCSPGRLYLLNLKNRVALLVQVA